MILSSKETTIVKRHRTRRTSLPADTAPAILRWLLRILVPLGAHREFVGANGFGNDALAELLGLGAWIDPPDGHFDTRAIRAALRAKASLEEQGAQDAVLPPHLDRNVRRLAQLVGLTAVDCRILEFTVLIHNERLLDDTADWLGSLSSVKVLHTLAVLLDLPEPDVRLALSPQGTLARSGLVAVDRNGASTLRGKLTLLSENFADRIISSDTDPVSLLRDMVAVSAPAQLTLGDYAHLAPSLAVLRPYLRHAVTESRAGTNIYLHGVPGTGKTQLARALAADLQCELFEVTSEDGDGDPISGDRRLRAFRAAQSFFGQRKVLMVFDEAEDVFHDGDGMFGRRSTAHLRKAWVNRMLEENPVPTLWLSNAIDGLDAAFIRRFDMVIELPVPPRRQRERIIEASCANLLDAAQIAHLAESPDLAPAVVTRAASVVRAIGDTLADRGRADVMHLLIDNTLRAQGHAPLANRHGRGQGERYDPALINADCDMAEVAAGLATTRSGRLCLYGPPGTGKTAYGRWLADQLEIPLLIKRGSDLMSKYVGDNEKNIAGAFRQAQQDGALLLIDEVDSFLQDRRGARQGWEVSLVNEMLTQMEAFDGVFIASTNLMDGLDQAALRRFDLKARFGFLQPAQAQALFQRYCAALTLPAPAPETVAALGALPWLTPGDFAAVARQHRFRAVTSVAGLLQALQAECRLKEGARTAIGFV